MSLNHATIVTTSHHNKNCDFFLNVKNIGYKQIYILLFFVGFMSSCGSQDTPSRSIETTNEIRIPFIEKIQIAEYIRDIFQDKNGNLWFGTNGYGVAHYDGDSISYYSNTQGFNGQQITGITVDQKKNIWFATDQGIVKYDWSSTADGKKQFINYTDQAYFGGQRFWSICADSHNTIWAGSAIGIFRYDGVKWETFELPYPEEVTGNFITKRTTWSISEDKAGTMWFSTNGYGAYAYDPIAEQAGRQAFSQYSEKDGLTDNSVDIIIEDSRENVWFGTRFGGISRYDGKSFTNYTARDRIGNNEVCIIYEDSKGNIWFSSEGYGVYQYNGESFTNYSQQQGLGVRAVQTIFEDDKGRLWVGGGGGLFRFDPTADRASGQSFYNVTKDGPWN